MTRGQANEYLAECFWPGVRDADLTALDERAIASAAQLSSDGQAVRYLGSLLMREDEVVLCRFQGSEAAVRSAAQLAAIPFERILEVSASRWPDEAGMSGEGMPGGPRPSRNFKTTQNTVRSLPLHGD